MPITFVSRCESPGDAVAVQPGLDLWVFGDITWVVIIDKVVAVQLLEDREGGQCQSQINAKSPIFA